MTGQTGIPKGAVSAINDLLDSCVKVQPGQEVLLLAEVEGLYGGDGMVDQEAISWIQSGVQDRGAKASALWIDEKLETHGWRIPPVVKEAIDGCDILINNTFNMSTTDVGSLREYINKKNKFKTVRNFATTSSLLCTAWAQTPYELVSEIRYQASLSFKAGKPFKLTDPNGTHLEGTVGEKASGSYSKRGGARGNIYFWPEWLHPTIRIENTNGVFIFESMLSFWSRYIGISPYLNTPIELIIKDNRITDIRGGEEAEALRNFLASMVERLGDGVYNFERFHFGVHPQAVVATHQCPNPLIRRVIEHSHSCNIHFHIGNAPFTPQYPCLMHCTGDIRTPTLRVGDTIVHDRGHLTALENPAVLAVAEKYSDRPGTTPGSRSF